MQVEGATSQGGRSPSIWDTFSAHPGRVAGNDSGAVAANHYQLYQQDIKLMVALGIKHYRCVSAVQDGSGKMPAAAATAGIAVALAADARLWAQQQHCFVAYHGHDKTLPVEVYVDSKTLHSRMVLLGSS